MKLRRVVTVASIIAAVSAVAALSFFIGSMTGPRAQLAHLNLQAEQDGHMTGYLALYSAEWPAEEIAEAVCGTRSDLDTFHHTYALSGPGSHYIFSCAEPEKDTK